MDTTSTFLLILSLIVSVVIAYFLYYYKSKSIGKVTIYLFILRSLTFFLLFVLLINPTISKNKIIEQKPGLSVVVDNSRSIQYFKQDSLVKNILSEWKSNSTLNEKFDVSYFSFGDELRLNDSLKFDQDQTNISKSLGAIGKLTKGQTNPVILLTDGNQTLGNDYEYISIQNTIYPIVVGDTTTYEDLSISQLNVNRFSFLNNQFPVEAIVMYEGENSVNAVFSIESRGRVVFRKSVRLDSEKNTQTIQVNLKSDKEGINFYQAKLSILSNEKNTVNNEKQFSVEVIDKQSQILILSSLYHPDLGALKKSIERDQQRKATIRLIDDDFQINDFQLVVLYQPNNQFKNVIQSIKTNKINYFLITGTQTDWNFINSEQLGIEKNSINQSEDYLASYNGGYLNFSQKDIGFNDLPPLNDKFGETTISIPHQTLLYQIIEGFSTKNALLATADENNQKRVFLLGEGIWKWRANSYINYNSFEQFDTFLGNLIQYAASTKIRDRLDIDINSLYNANEMINIGAFYVDQNFEFDPRATIILEYTNKNTNESRKVPFSLASSSYQVGLELLESGEYDYVVSVEGQNISKKGSFKISEFSVEEQFTNANKDKLSRLASKTGGKLFSIDKSNALIQDLISNSQFKIKQRSVLTKEAIINWQWLLFVITGLLALEWFIRKYHGKI